MRSSNGKITHRRATPGSGGRIVEHPGVAIRAGSADEHEPGRRGYVIVTADGPGAWAIRDTGRRRNSRGVR